MPWEAEQDIENELFEERYIIYSDWDTKLITQWRRSLEIEREQRVLHEVTDFETRWGFEGLDDHERFQPYPDCAAKDEAALKGLLRKIGMSTHVRLSW